MLEIYVSTDVETDGPVAGKHSILSIGSAAYGRKGNAFDILRQLGNIAERASRFQDRCLVADAAGSVVGVQAEPRAPARCHGALCHLAQVASREAGLRRLSDRVRLSLRLLVSDGIRRREPVRLFGNRHQNLFDGANAQAISHVREAVDAGGMARSGPAYSCGARRRHRAGATVLQYAESQSRGRLTES